MCYLFTGENYVETCTEADSNDITECSHDDKPSRGMLGLLTSDKGPGISSECENFDCILHTLFLLKVLLM